MHRDEPIRILLIDDDEGARHLTESILDQIDSAEFELDWVATAPEGLDAVRAGEHDLYLVDYRLEGESGIDLVRRARAELVRAPMILLTGKGRWEVDVEAMEAGVSDYLDKTRVDPELMERTMRYALERARTEAALRESEARHRSMFDHLPVGLFRVTPEGELLEANPALVQMLGNPDRDTLERAHARDLFVGPDRREALLERLDRFGEVRGFETRIRRSDGRTVDLRCSARAHRDEDGRTVYLEGAVEDVTEERAEQDLRARAARFDWVFRDWGVPILLLDLDGRLLAGNAAFLRVFGYGRDHLAGRPLVDLAVEGERDALDAAVRAVAADGGDGPAESERRLLAADGAVLWAHTRTGLVRNARGGPDHLIMILEDVAEAHGG